MPKKRIGGFLEKEIQLRITFARKQGTSYQKIANALNLDGIGIRPWSWQTVRNAFLGTVRKSE